MQPPDDHIDFAPALESDTRRDAIALLEANRIDPKFLYVTRHQAELWREVFLRHSPIHANPEFARIYREAFDKVARDSRVGEVRLVGLGCGTGMKERDLAARLKSSGANVRFSAVDVSRELIVESMRNLAASGATLGRSLVCDLTQTDALSAWLDQHTGGAPRVLTLFGLVPNLAPPDVVWIARAVLRPGDLLLVSAHLAPVSEGIDLSAAMRRVLPQYDNPETLAWLAAGLEQLDLTSLAAAPEMTIGEIDGVPAFIAEARWKSSRPFEKWGRTFSPDPARALRVFHSLRYTPTLFEGLLIKHGFAFERLAITACGEEAIWAVRAGA